LIYTKSSLIRKLFGRKRNRNSSRNKEASAFLWSTVWGMGTRISRAKEQTMQPQGTNKRIQREIIRPKEAGRRSKVLGKTIMPYLTLRCWQAVIIIHLN
jgi:hypothetical protein